MLMVVNGKGRGTNITRTLGFYIGSIDMVRAKYFSFKYLDPLGM